MAKRKRALKNLKEEKNLFNSIPMPKLPELDIDPDIRRGIFIVVILALGALGILSIFELSGVLGVYYMKGLAYLFGWGRYSIPFLLLLWGGLLYKNDKEFKGANLLGLFILVISVLSLFQLSVPFENWKQALKIGTGGGYIGYFIGIGFMKIMGLWASLVIFIALLLISLMLLFDASLYSIIGHESPFAKVAGFFQAIWRKIFKREEDEDEDEEDLGEEEEEESEGENEEEEKENEDEEEDNEEESDEDEATTEENKYFKSKKTGIYNEKNKQDGLWKPTNLKIELPLELLSNKQGKPMSGDIGNNKLIIERTLKNFGIEVELGEVSVGPTVTQYTFKPADGVKLTRITTLNNNLALALAAHPIRIEAPIPGRALVGLEVPNHTKAVVGLREILQSSEFKEKKSNHFIALGKDVAGKCWSYDITKMPHLLVAGATGSGKSVCLNSVIVSLLYQNNPDDLRFIMVDPKRVELPTYNGIPHLLTPVITEVDKTINALRWCLNEMDRRFDALALSGKRNIQTYNATAKVKLPYIVFIIDELADLMVVAARDVESAVIRLAQMARAVGIHLVLATQRPSVDVITGLIKANMPARIAFSVASGVDSRTILDSLGAEKLLGSGDMLFVTAELSKPKRIQGTFISELEVKKIVRHIKEVSGEPNYIKEVVERQKVKGIAGVGMGSNNGGDDEFFEEAKEIVINMGRASTSLLQRRLKVGYGRAAKLVDMLEEAGVVGPSNGAKAREILISREQYENLAEESISGMPLHNREESKPKEKYLPDEDESEDDEDEEEDEDEGQQEDGNGEDDDLFEEDGDEDEEDAEEPDDEEEEPEPKKNSTKNKQNQNGQKKDYDREHDFRLFSK